MTDLHYLALSALLCWVMLVVASLLRSRSWTPAGAQVALGNRDHVPEPSPLAGRADRAARNMLEGLLLPYLRTLVWVASILALGRIASAAF